MIVPIRPDPKITGIGLNLNLRRATKLPTNKANSTIRKLDKIISCFSAWNNANVKIDKPADEISETTAGRKLDKIV